MVVKGDYGYTTCKNIGLLMCKCSILPGVSKTFEGMCIVPAILNTYQALL